MVEERKAGQQRRKKHRKLWIVLLVVVGLPVGLAGYIAWFVTGRPTISHDYAADYNALTRPANYDPNENAAPYYEKAFAMLTEPPTGWPRPASFQPKQNTSGAQRRFIEPWVTSNAPALELIAQAVAKPYYWVECTSFDSSETFKNLAAYRWAVPCLCYRARLQAADGHPAEAFQSIMIAHRMTRQLSRDGTEANTLVAMAVDALSRSTAYALLAEGNIPSNALSALQQDLESTQPIGISSRIALMGGTDRVRWLNGIQSYFTDNGRGGGHVVFKRLYEDSLHSSQLRTQMDEAVVYFKQLWIAWRNPSRKKTIRSMDDCLEAMNRLSTLTPWQLHEKGTSSQKAANEQVRGNHALQILSGALPPTIDLCWRSYTSESAFVATLAIWRYKQDKGAWPDSLQQLVEQGYLRRVPMDPYSDGPLVYKPTGTTFTLYSFGFDFDDDGGTPDAKKGSYNGDDVFWPVP
jgi:hypothetical protein